MAPLLLPSPEEVHYLLARGAGDTVKGALTPNDTQK